jgi:hypothetical protein
VTRNDAERAQRLADLLSETAHAHHQAYAHTDGEDPEWPIWYAGYLHERIATLLDTPFTRSELVYLLVAAAREHAARDPQADWPAFYATFFLSGDTRRGPS